LLHPRQDRRDPVLAVKAQRIGPGQIGLGRVQLGLGNTAARHIGPLFADQIDRLGHGRVRGSHLPHPQRRAVERCEPGIDTIGQAALLAQFGHQARFEARTADDLVDHEGGNEIGIVLGNGRLAEHRDRLRGVEGHHRKPARRRRGWRTRQGRARRGQPAKQGVEQRRQFLGADIAGHADMDIAAGQRGGVGGAQIVGRQRGDGGRVALGRVTIGMVAEHRRKEGVRGLRLGVLRVLGEAGEDLRTHPLDRVGVKARHRQRIAQQRHAFRPVLGQHAGRNRHRVAAGAKLEPGGQRLGLGLKAGGVSGARAFLQQGRHQVDRARPVGRVDRAAARKAQIDRDEGQAAILYQPGGQAARRRHLFDVEGGADRQRGEQKAERNNEAGDHWVASAICGAGARR
jgi:hypothetical protein